MGPSRGSVDDLARSVARECGATIGLHRFSVTQLAARLAAASLADARLAPATYLGSEAVAARAVFETQRAGSLDYFGPVAATPGFPRALARTLQELRMAHVAADDLAALPLGGTDLSALLQAFEQQFVQASATDRATLFAAATAAVQSGGGASVPLVLLDVGFESEVDFDFLHALIRASPDVLITVPFGDVQALQRLESIGVTAQVLDPSVTTTGAGHATDLIALRRNLFARRQPPAREQTGDVRIFSAPGEGRESVEIARRILEEARAGVAFDEIAVFVRSPQRYAGLLEHAFKRAGIPAWFDRGTVRPHPAGRAFMAVLACACEKLSARRFAEYLSLAQVPAADVQRSPAFIAPNDELLGPAAERGDDREDEQTPFGAEPERADRG